MPLIGAIQNDSYNKRSKKGTPAFQPLQFET